MVNNLGSDLSELMNYLNLIKFCFKFCSKFKRNIYNKYLLSDKKSDIIIKINHRKSFNYLLRK